MTKLCARGKAAAKRKFRVYPSAYANAYASKICAGKAKDPSGLRRKDFKGPKPAGKVSGGMIKASLGTLVKDLFSRVTGNKKSTVGSNTSSMSFKGNKLPITDLYQKAVSQKKANKGTFVQTLQPYDGSYIKGNLAGHNVSNKSLNNYYKGMIDE